MKNAELITNLRFWFFYPIQKANRHDLDAGKDLRQREKGVAECEIVK